MDQVALDIVHLLFAHQARVFLAIHDDRDQAGGAEPSQHSSRIAGVQGDVDRVHVVAVDDSRQLSFAAQGAHMPAGQRACSCLQNYIIHHNLPRAPLTPYERLKSLLLLRSGITFALRMNFSCNGRTSLQWQGSPADTGRSGLVPEAGGIIHALRGFDKQRTFLINIGS